MRKLELNVIRSGPVIAYHLQFKEYGGWATFYIDDERGTLAVVSDWGTRSYRWGRGAWLSVEPPNLSQALLHFTRDSNGHDNYDYVAGKLFASDRYVHDQEATEREFKKRLLSQRREGWLERDEARELWEELGEIDFSSADSTLTGIAEASSALSELFDCTCEYLQDGPAPDFLLFRDHILPLFIEHLRREDTRKKAELSHTLACPEKHECPGCGTWGCPHEPCYCDNACSHCNPPKNTAPESAP